MNTNLISNDRPARAVRSADLAGDESHPASNQLTVEQLAAMAMRYWPDFLFGAAIDRRLSDARNRARA